MHTEDQRAVRQIERRVLRFISEHDLMPAGGIVVLAVSGGPDSLALLHIAASVRASLGVESWAVYVDHAIRPATDIAAERDFVAAEADRVGVRFLSVQSAMVGRDAKGLSPEDAARWGRYAALAAAAAEVGAHTVATGHTRSDQAETVLIRVLRGSGLRGVGAMAPAAGWPLAGVDRPALVRPLLGLWRVETESYCAMRGLCPRRDPENTNPRYLRNRLRAELMPLLASLNPRVESVLADLADEARDWRGVVERGVSPLEVEFEREGRGAVALDVDVLRRMEVPRRLHALRSALDAVTDGEYRPSRRQLLALDRLARGPRGRSVALAGGVRAWREGGNLMVATSEPAMPPAIEGERAVVVPGSTELDGWSITADLVGDVAGVPQGEWQRCFAVAAIGGATVGPRRPGDRIELAGMNGRRRLQDVFVDLGVPRAWRDRWPVFRTDRGVLWVPGLTRAARWAEAHSGAAIRVRVQPTDPAVRRWRRL